MLDAYIIERIRREREAERNDGAFVPLRIETPRAPMHDDDLPRPERPEDDRGTVIIDFNL